MREITRRYKSYLLRIWGEGGTDTQPAIWRFSLEDTRTGQRENFASLLELLVTLDRRLANRKDSSSKAQDEAES
ncbi:hypothetical protein KFU94_63545 [Chloroflexi bacterium TSY]|nr:hypothetical protein [Chloroflexi bacterium TSY]